MESTYLLKLKTPLRHLLPPSKYLKIPIAKSGPLQRLAFLSSHWRKRWGLEDGRLPISVCWLDDEGVATMTWPDVVIARRIFRSSILTLVNSTLLCINLIPHWLDDDSKKLGWSHHTHKIYMWQHKRMSITFLSKLTRTLYHLSLLGNIYIGCNFTYKPSL